MKALKENLSSSGVYPCNLKLSIQSQCSKYLGKRLAIYKLKCEGVGRGCRDRLHENFLCTFATPFWFVQSLCECSDICLHMPNHKCLQSLPSIMLHFTFNCQLLCKQWTIGQTHCPYPNGFEFNTLVPEDLSSRRSIWKPLVNG